MKFFRYIMIQLFAYLIDMGSFIMIFGFFILNPIAANMMGKLAGGVFAFVAHRNITFKSNHKKDRAAQARRFFLLSILNIPLSSIALMVLLQGVPYAVLAKFMADVSCVFLNYWINKTFVFVSRQHG